VRKKYRSINQGGITMNKTEFVAAIAEEAGISKADAAKAVSAFTNVVVDELKKGEKIQLVGFGTFEVSKRPERQGINPATKEKITIAAANVPKFKAGAALKNALN
jgi:DNA-binding protein HU-beta